MRAFLVFILVSIFTVNYAQDDSFLLTKLACHKNVITALDFNKSGSMLASASKEKDLTLTNTSDWEVAHSYINYYIIDDIKFTSDETLLHTSGKAIRYIDTKNTELELFEGSATYVLKIDYSLDSDKMVGASYNRQVWVWDISSGNQAAVLEGHEKNAQTAAISGSMPYVVSGSVDGTIRVWNLLTAETKYLIERHVKAVYDVAFHPNGKYFLSCSADRNIILWDATTGNLLKVYGAHKQDVVQVAFTSDGEHFFSASADGTVIVWQTRTGKALYSFIDHVGVVTSLAVDPKGKYLATGGEDGNIFIYDIDKKIFVVSDNPDAYTQFKSENSVFDEKRKGEKKDEYEARVKRASKLEQEWVEKEYTKYINKLKSNIYNEGN